MAIFNNKRGFTLIEVLAAVTILSLVVLPMFSFFIQAYDYTNKNERNTVLINVARGAIEFMENQDFHRLKEKIIGDVVETCQPVNQYNVYVGLVDGNVTDPSDSTKKIQVYNYQNQTKYEDTSLAESDKIKQIIINNIKYNTFVELTLDAANQNYFINMAVYVWEGDDKYTKPSDPTLRGRIVNDAIR